MSHRMYPDDVEKKNRGFLGYDSSALPPRDRQVSDTLHSTSQPEKKEENKEKK